MQIGKAVLAIDIYLMPSRKFTVEKQAAETLEPLALVEQNQSDMSCSLDNPDACEACGS